MLSSGLLRLCLDHSCFGFALEPQVNRVATDIEQLTRFAFLETVQFNRLPYLLPEVFTVGFRHLSQAETIEITYSLFPNMVGYSYKTCFGLT